MCHFFFSSHALRLIFLLISQMRSLRPERQGDSNPCLASPGESHLGFPTAGKRQGASPFLPLTPTPARTATGTEAQAGQATGDPKVIGGQWGGQAERMGEGGVGETLTGGNESGCEKKERGKKSRN